MIGMSEDVISDRRPHLPLEIRPSLQVPILFSQLKYSGCITYLSIRSSRAICAGQEHMVMSFHSA